MRVCITTESFDPLQAISEYQSESMQAGNYGACAHFVGTLREHNAGRTVREMTLEHYPEMSQKHLEHLAQQAIKEWKLLGALVIHRVGTIQLGEPIVLVAVWSPHRREAFRACEKIMEVLKSQAPFWKKERTDSGEHWVEKNTPGE